ncbi:MAG: type II toxin-antitoxin system prevent-host-death family antitoxin [Spirochaetes bacterium]|nr:type II toxin-antitoxin system prevent-host-death family antitoxin [Spirochaetota bacterium]
MTNSYGVADFKAHCLKILEEVATQGQAVEVCKRGKPLVRVLPAVVAEPAPAYGFLQGTACYADDLLSTGESWQADHE